MTNTARTDPGTTSSVSPTVSDCQRSPVPAAITDDYGNVVYVRPGRSSFLAPMCTSSGEAVAANTRRAPRQYAFCPIESRFNEAATGWEDGS